MRAATVTVTVLAAVYLLSFVNCDESVKKFKRNTMTQERKFFGDENSKTVQELILEFNQTGTHNLIREYDEISKKEPAGTFNSAKLPENIFKNRYAEDGLLSFDHSRVVLSKDENSTSDYINANFVDGYRHKNTFISTQGPLESTVVDFWRMIWDQKTLVIAMTTRLREKEKEKCFQYWNLNEGEVAVFGNFEIATVLVDDSNGFTVTSMEVTNLKTKESRKLTHFYFTSWPDLGVPSSPKLLLTFIDQFKEKQAEMVEQLGDKWSGDYLGPPIVVHCSAGVGRTGTLMTIYTSILQLKSTGKVDIRGTVKNIRSQRAFAVETRDQYIFCHTAIIEYAKHFLCENK